MPNTTEDKLRLELMSAQREIASLHRQLNWAQQQRLFLAESVQSTLHYLRLPGASVSSAHFQELMSLLNRLTTLHIEQIKLLQALPQKAVPDLYDLSTLQVDPYAASNRETPIEKK